MLRCELSISLHNCSPKDWTNSQGEAIQSRAHAHVFFNIRRPRSGNGWLLLLQRWPHGARQWFEAINCQRPRSLAKVGGISNDCNRAAFPTRNSGPSLLERVLLVFDVVRVDKEADATFNNRIQNQFNCFRFQTHSGSGLIIIRPIKTAVVQ